MVVWYVYVLEDWEMLGEVISVVGIMGVKGDLDSVKIL